uniref:ORF57g n=1 Tax=Pinus koraiensis TaxID=88728 RepID=Q85WW3_PINKO|nr:ORF57g [Pinus koraiensis]AAO74106.1 ORF57g [Pinus koraiensis]
MIKRYTMNWGQFFIHHPFKKKLGSEDSLLEQIFETGPNRFNIGKCMIARSRVFRVPI